MGRGRPKSFDPETVLDVALQVFWDHGFDETGLAEITRRTGVGKQSLYDTFGTKRALFERVLERYASASEAEWTELLGGDRSPAEGLAAFVDRWTECPAEIEGRGCLLVGSIQGLAGRDERLAERVAAHLERQRALLCGAFERARAAGELPPDSDPASLAAHWLATVLGMATLARLPDRAASVAQVARGLRAELAALRAAATGSGR